MADAQVPEAYAARSAEYISLFGSIDAAAEIDREHLLAWAHGVDGRIIDVGCGPGQWTSYLSERGVAVEGVDPVPEFVNHARQSIPASRTGSVVRIGSASRVQAWEECSPGSR